MCRITGENEEVNKLVYRFRLSSSSLGKDARRDAQGWTHSCYFFFKDDQIFLKEFLNLIFYFSVQ